MNPAIELRLKQLTARNGGTPLDDLMDCSVGAGVCPSCGLIWGIFLEPDYNGESLECPNCHKQKGVACRLSEIKPLSQCVKTLSCEVVFGQKVKEQLIKGMKLQLEQLQKKRKRSWIKRLFKLK